MGLTLIQHTSAVDSTSAVTLAVPITASVTGHPLIIAAVNGGTRTVSQVQDNIGNTYTQAIGAVATSGVKASDIWYCLNPTGGVTSVTITFSGAVGATFGKDGWVFEIEGFSTPAFDTANAVNNGVQSAAASTGAAVTSSVVKGFAVAAVITSNSITGNPQTGNEFSTGGDITGNQNAACSEITSGGTHTPVWQDGGTTFCASTVLLKETVFKAAQFVPFLR